MSEDPVLFNDWHPVAAADSVAEGALVGVKLLEHDIVVWRAGDELRAWRDRCVHRGTRLSLGNVIDGDCVQCPYHGWIYDRNGRCVHIPAMPGHEPPARAQVQSFAVQERYGLLWVCLGEPAADISPFPEWASDTFRKIRCGPYPVKTSGPRIIENFLDVAHFSFVHENILGVRDHAEIDDYDVAVGPEGVEATNVRVYQPDPYGTGKGDVVAYTYRACRPLTAYLLKESDGPRFSILLAVTPHSPEHSTAWMWMAMNYAHEQPADTLVAWQDEIFSQDRPILESQAPAALPLEPEAELSMRCDRTSIAYRRWLKTLGVRFGVVCQTNAAGAIEGMIL
ncbi:MAG: Rieske 2Fe-2S domain-containing protein [Gammaproteobacteria bacterium]